MSVSFKTAQLGISALISIPILICLAWGGLTLPFDFQPDPNYSHVLNGLHIADTGRFDNTFYPGVVNFYLMALFNLVAGVELPSSELFGLSSVEKATYIARTAQLTITLFTIWAWLYAFSSLVSLREENHGERFSFSVALLSTLCLMLFSYSFVYQSYFLRPDNSLSLCLALGIALFSKINNSISNDERLTHAHLLWLGVWIFFMTATKSQGQAFIGVGTLYILYISTRKMVRLTQPFIFVKIAQAILAISLFGLLVIATKKMDGFSFENKAALIAITVFLAITLLISLITDTFLAMAALHIATGWCICLIFIYFLTNAQSQSVLEIANPIHSLIVQAKYNNLKISSVPLFFHLKHLVIYGIAPLFLCLLGAIAFRRKTIFLLMALGALMIFTVSLRLPGYYNGILFMPFFFIAAGLAIYYGLNTQQCWHGYLIVMLLIGVHIALNISLHSSHITALRATCLNRGSLAGARYYPDTINIEYTFRNEGWAEYSKHYFTVITDFDYWPTIREKIKSDTKFQELLQGTLTTCPIQR